MENLKEEVKETLLNHDFLYSDISFKEFNAEDIDLLADRILSVFDKHKKEYAKEILQPIQEHIHYILIQGDSKSQTYFHGMFVLAEKIKSCIPAELNISTLPSQLQQGEK